MSVPFRQSSEGLPQDFYSLHWVEIMNFYAKLTACLFLSMTSLTFVGCGANDGKMTASGSVTWNGSPLSEGYITFYPTAGGNPSATTISNGSFSTRVTPGENRIQVISQKHIGDQPKTHEGVPPTPIIVQIIPSKYNDKSELVHTFDKNNTRVELALSGEENKPNPKALSR